MNEGNTTQLQCCLDLLRTGDDQAREALIQKSCERLRRLTRKMLKGYPRLQRWEQTDDVLQNALVRLHRSLAEIKPKSSKEFFGLAATQIRRSLIDLTRHNFGPEGQAAHHETDYSRSGSDTPKYERGFEPHSLEGWEEFHKTVAALPEKEREIFGLLWINGLTQNEAAEVLGIDLRTVKRHWKSARLMIYEALGGQSPER